MFHYQGSPGETKPSRLTEKPPLNSSNQQLAINPHLLIPFQLPLQTSIPLLIEREIEGSERERDRGEREREIEGRERERVERERVG